MKMCAVLGGGADEEGEGGGRLFLAGGGQPMGVSPSPWGWGESNM